METWVLLCPDMGQSFKFTFDTVLGHYSVVPLAAPQPYLVVNMW